MAVQPLYQPGKRARLRKRIIYTPEKGIFEANTPTGRLAVLPAGREEFFKGVFSVDRHQLVPLLVIA
jgi:hypothetical protein